MSMINLVPLPIRDRYRHYWHKLRELQTPSIIHKINWWLTKPTLPDLSNGYVNLHLGCGEIDHPGFINIDLVPYKHVHYLRAIDDLSIFPDESVDLIYASHCLEHFSFKKVPEVLSEWQRVLKKGGKIRLSVPDFDSIIDIYGAAGNDIESVQMAVVGGQNFEFNYHYVIFNKKYLCKLLVQAGFSDVKEWNCGANELTNINDYSKEEFVVGGKAFPVSLNLEARK